MLSQDFNATTPPRLYGLEKVGRCIFCRDMCHVFSLPSVPVITLFRTGLLGTLLMQC